MNDPEPSTHDSEASDTAQPVICDFCGRAVDSVRRVALDRDYERLRTPHAVQYACPECSERKERRRQGLDRG